MIVGYVAIDLQTFEPTYQLSERGWSGSQPPQDAGFAEPGVLCRQSRA